MSHPDISTSGAEPDVLVVFATTHGHTRKVAEHLANALSESGVGAHLADAGRHHVPEPGSFGGVAVLASLHGGKHQKDASAWVSRHAGVLNERPSAFLSVSLTAADDTDEARERTGRVIEEFLAQTHWRPSSTLAVAGALQYREYDLPTRVLMRLIARAHHQPTDPSQDIVYTDWDAVARAGHGLAAQVLAAAAPVAS